MATLIKASFEGRNVNLAEDFALQYQLDSKQADTLDVLTYRNPDSGQPDAAEKSPARSHDEPGFFEAQALIASGATVASNGGESKNLVVLFDNSLSMQWEKLERSYAAMETVLRSLHPEDHFNLLLFNNKVAAFQPELVPADRDNVQKALDFVRASRLRGGTDLQQALGAGLAQFSQSSWQRLPPAAERWRRDPRHHPHRKPCHLVRRTLETGAGIRTAAHLCICRGR